MEGKSAENRMEEGRITEGSIEGLLRGLNLNHKKQLRRKFGEFRCSKCKKQWHSAVVWCNQGGNAEYGQKCKKCKIQVFPFRISELNCPKCGESVKECECEKQKKIVYDENKPHRTELCGRCIQLGRPCFQRNSFYV